MTDNQIDFIKGIIVNKGECSTNYREKFKINCHTCPLLVFDYVSIEWACYEAECYNICCKALYDEVVLKPKMLVEKLGENNENKKKNKV